jgi:hypothetical protein
MIRFISRGVESLALGTMAVLMPLSPVACTILSGQVRYLRSYRSSIIQSRQCVKALKRTRVISRNLQRVLGGGARAEEKIEGHCTHCGLCCIDRSCVFLAWKADGSSHCSIYNNWFWRRTSCGSYPIDGESIAVYGCPTFKAIPIKVIK